MSPMSLTSIRSRKMPLCHSTPPAVPKVNQSINHHRSILWLSFFFLYKKNHDYLNHWVLGEWFIGVELGRGGSRIPKFAVIGHRGSGMNVLQSSDRRMRAIKENSIISFNRAASFPIDFVEFDVQVFFISPFFFLNNNFRFNVQIHRRLELNACDYHFLSPRTVFFFFLLLIISVTESDVMSGRPTNLAVSAFL